MEKASDKNEPSGRRQEDLLRHFAEAGEVTDVSEADGTIRVRIKTEKLGMHLRPITALHRLLRASEVPLVADIVIDTGKEQIPLNEISRVLQQCLQRGRTFDFMITGENKKEAAEVILSAFKRKLPFVKALIQRVFSN